MNQYDIPDEYLRAIGRIVVAWNELEDALTHALVSVLIEDISAYTRATAAFVHMSFPQKLDALSSMLRTVKEESADLYRSDVQGLLKQAQEKRNSVVHQLWYIEQGEVRRGDVKARGSLKVTDQVVSLQELHEIILFINDAHIKLLSVVIFPLSVKFIPQQGQ